MTLGVLDTLPNAPERTRLYHQWCALPTRRALVTHSPYILPKYMFLNLPRDVICSTASFRLRVHTLRFETVTWNQSNSPTCDLCDTDSPRRAACSFPLYQSPHDFSPQEYAPLFPPTGAHDVFTFLSQNSDKLLTLSP